MRKILAIPGPVELSPAVAAAAAAPPLGHQDPALIEAFGRTLEHMRTIWGAAATSQPFLIAGSGTLAMDSAVVNLVRPGDRVVVVVTGYFSERLSEMVRRSGGTTVEVRGAGVGEPPSAAEVAAVVAEEAQRGPLRALTLTHVDTSSGIRLDPGAFANIAREHNLLFVVDGVCATGGEVTQMADWGADVVLTGSQKALGGPPGLALLVASDRALAARRELAGAPPMMLDWLCWLPVHQAYEARQPGYFATPATSLVMAMATALDEVVTGGVTNRVADHTRAATAMAAAWLALELRPVPTATARATTLSNLWLPDGLDDRVRASISARGVVVAGGLLPELRGKSIRVGHMGAATQNPQQLVAVIEAVAGGLAEHGWGDAERSRAAVEAFEVAWGR